jgi:hypothetical protein
MSPYKSQNALIPLGVSLPLFFHQPTESIAFMLLKLDGENDADTTDEEASLTFKILMTAGFNHAELFEAYHQVASKV